MENSESKKKWNFEYTRTGPFFWMFVDKDNCKFVKIQICYGEYLWLLAVKHKKKEMEGDSLLEGKCLSLLMVMENKEEKYGHSLLEGKRLLTVGLSSLTLCTESWIYLLTKKLLSAKKHLSFTQKSREAWPLALLIDWGWQNQQWLLIPAPPPNHRWPN